LAHYDFYRLDDPGLLRHELEESFNDERTVTVIEWAQIVKDVLPDKRLTITIDKTGDDARSFTIQYPQELKYLVEENK
jgi:tRNA A37 threonylcarbamoyladenosine biosynthesis protein TsaE